MSGEVRIFIDPFSRLVRENAHHLSSEIKIQKVALASLGALCLAAALAVGLSSFHAFVVTSSLVSLSYELFYSALRLKDYQDLSTLKKVQQRASTLSLVSLLDEHLHFCVLIQHEILTKKQLVDQCLQELKGKSLASFFQQIPLEEFFKGSLFPPKDLRLFVEQELEKQESCLAFYEALGETLIQELLRFEVLSFLEVESFLALRRKEEKLLQNQQREKLLLDLQFLGRRSSLIKTLQFKKQELQKSLNESSEKEHRMELSVLEEEKQRIEETPSIGLELEKGFMDALDQLKHKHQKEKQKIQDDFAFLKRSFYSSISRS